MKKLILTFILFTSYFSNAQCEFNLKELSMSVFYNGSAFDDFVLTNGFTLNTRNNNYECKSQNSNNDFVNKVFFNNGNSIKLLYTTFSKSIYLKTKEQIYSTNYKFIEEKNTNNGKSFSYSLKGMNLTITTKELNGVNTYEFLFIYNKQKT